MTIPPEVMPPRGCAMPVPTLATTQTLHMLHMVRARLETERGALAAAHQRVTLELAANHRASQVGANIAESFARIEVLAVEQQALWRRLQHLDISLFELAELGTTRLASVLRRHPELFMRGT